MGATPWLSGANGFLWGKSSFSIIQAASRTTSIEYRFNNHIQVQNIVMEEVSGVGESLYFMYSSIIYLLRPFYGSFYAMLHTGLYNILQLIFPFKSKNMKLGRLNNFLTITYTVYKIYRNF